MTKLPAQEEIDARSLLNPIPGTLHVRELIDRAKDGDGAKDNLSDHCVGMIKLALAIGDVTVDEAGVFQLPFVERKANIRTPVQHLGLPFLGPDGLVVRILEPGRKPVELHGENPGNIGISPLTLNEMLDHPQFAQWRDNVLYAGGTRDSSTYIRQRRHLNTKKKCDAHVNSMDYRPGSLSTPRNAVGDGDREEYDEGNDEGNNERDDEGDVVVDNGRVDGGSMSRQEMERVMGSMEEIRSEMRELREEMVRNEEKRRELRERMERNEERMGDLMRVFGEHLRT